MTAKRKSDRSAPKKAKSVAKAKPARTAKKKSASKKRTAAKPAAAVKTRAEAPKRRPVEAAKSKSPKRRGRPQQPLDLERFRVRLRERQADLLQAYLVAKGDSRSRASDGTEDYIDYAVSSYDREFLLSLTELEQTELHLVDDALKRLDSGTFGLCVQCERPIASKRIEVQPWARYCLRCQELADSGLGAGGFEFPSDDEDEEAVSNGLPDDFDVDEDSDEDEDAGGEQLSG